MPRKARNVENEGAGPRSQRMRSRSGSSSCWHVLRCRCVVRSGCVELLRRLRTPGILVRLERDRNRIDSFDTRFDTIMYHAGSDVHDRRIETTNKRPADEGGPAARGLPSASEDEGFLKHERAPRTPLERATVPRRRPGTRTAWDVARRWLSRILRFQISELENFHTNAYLT
jgi:hypothetical protein